MIKYRSKALLILTFLLGGVILAPAIYAANESSPMIKITTNQGEITIETYADEAPETVRNFVEYVDAGFFDGLIFHRVISGFMIQGGGFSSDMKQKSANAPIQNEADNGLKNTTGTLAMARTSDPHSATAQFFINLTDNGFLDHTAKTSQGWGYAVFGKVIEGMDVVEKIGEVDTGRSGGHGDVPVEPVIIEKAEVVAQ